MTLIRTLTSLLRGHDICAYGKKMKNYNLIILLPFSVDHLILREKEKYLELSSSRDLLIWCLVTISYSI